MAKLILSVDGQVLKEYQLTKERTLIGRKPHNDIPIDNLAVSGEHAAIITTMVNGKPVKKHFLQNNDVVEIGKHKLKYFNDAPTAATAADFEKTMIIRNPAKAAPPPPAADKGMGDTQTNLKAMAPETPKAAAAPSATTTATSPPAPAPAHAPAPPPPPPAASATSTSPPAPTPSSAPGAAAGATPLREAAIQVLSGAAAGRTLDLTKNLTTIGKPGLQVAVITKRPNGYFITHVEGATYPTLNGASLGAQARALGDHDLIEIAGVKMEFFYKP